MSYEDQLNALKAKVQDAKKEAVQPQQSPRVNLSKLSVETEAGLKKLLEANQNSTAQIKDEVETGEDGGVEEKKVEDDTFYYDDSTNSKRPNPYSTKRRQEIEARCSPIDIGDILIKRRVEQKIPIIPSKFEILVRDTSAAEDTYIKNLLSKEYYERTEVSASYITSKMARYRLTIGLLEINGVSLTDVKIKHEPPTKEEEDAFKKKLEMLSEYPLEIIADLDAQYMWFKDRVKLISMGKIQNF